MIYLLYLKHAFDKSEKGVCERWSEAPYWQYFFVMDCFEHSLPCDPNLMVNFLAFLGNDGIEELLAFTIPAAHNMKFVSKKQMQTLVVDTTVQHKAVAHPTDSRLLEVARCKLVQAAKRYGL
jgi:IS5 family transposase